MDIGTLNKAFQMLSVLLGILTALSSIGLFITQSKIDAAREGRLSSLGPRELSDAQKLAMLKVSRQFSNLNPLKYQIYPDHNSIDSQSFSAQIAQVLNAAGWEKDNFMGFAGPRASDKPGVTVMFNSMDKADGLNAAEEIFKAGNIEYRTEDRPFIKTLNDHRPPVMIAVNPRF